MEDFADKYGEHFEIIRQAVQKETNKEFLAVVCVQSLDIVSKSLKQSTVLNGGKSDSIKPLVEAIKEVICPQCDKGS